MLSKGFTLIIQSNNYVNIIPPSFFHLLDLQTGKRQEYELGLWLRQRYDSLLTEHYSPETFYIQSTDVDRCLMSAESVLAALYPPRDGQRWEPDLNWQPIPIHTTPEHMDKVGC